MAKVASMALWKEAGAHTLHEENGEKFLLDKRGVRIYVNERMEIHRDHGPAYISRELLMWYQSGKKHRLDGPAVLEIACNAQMWYKNGRLHRDGDFPAVIRIPFELAWYKNGKKYREITYTDSENSDLSRRF